MAQVNVEPFRAKLEKEGIGGEGRASLTAFSGNTSGTVMGASLLVGGQQAPHMAFLSMSGDYAHLNGQAQVSRGFGHARYNLELAEPLWAEVFAQLQSDRFRRIRARELAGVGPRFGLLRRDTIKLFLGVAYMAEHTLLDPEVSIQRPALVHRVSSYVALTLKAGSRIVLSNMTYLQPRIDELSDHNLLSVSTAQFEVTEVLKTQLDLSLRHESVTPPDVERTDVEFKSSLVLEL